MEVKLITLKLADNTAGEGAAGTNIIANTAHITHFHKAVQKEGNLTHIHFTGGQAALVTQTVQEIIELIEQPQTTTPHQSNLDKYFFQKTSKG